MNATFWLGTEQCSNQHQNLVPDESGSRSLHDTHTKKTGAGKIESIYGASFCSVNASWVSGIGWLNGKIHNAIVHFKVVLGPEGFSTRMLDY